MNKKVLLTTLNSQYVHSNLALKYLYESAGIYRNLIEVKEYTINNYDMQIFMDIMLGEYDIICFSCYIWNISRVIGLIKDIKKACPETVIVVGGPEVSYAYEEFLEKCPEADFVISGEGDVAFPNLLKEIVEGTVDFEQKLILGRIPEENEICFPYENTEIDRDRILYYESARGCPFRCSFCLSSVSRGVRLLSMERVKKELDFFLEQKVKQVKFVDRTFNIDMERSAEMMNYLIDNDNGITNFHFELCGDRISEEMLDAFERSRSGLFQVEIGVQSIHENVLEECNRRVDFDKLKDNTERIMAGGNVHVHLDLIAGLPYETYEMFGESFNRIYEMQPDDLQLGFLKLLKGTKVRLEAEKHGYVYRDKEPYEVISNSYISSKEIIELKKIEHLLELYFNKPGFRNSMRYLIDKSGLKPFDFYHTLAEYFYSCGYHEISLSKSRSYDILMEFGNKIESVDIDGLKELLLYDRILTAAPSQFTDRDYSDVVHGFIREGISEDDTRITAKNLIKKVNYMAFGYNVCEFDRESAELEKLEEKYLLIFYPEQKNPGGQSLCRKIKY